MVILWQIMSHCGARLLITSQNYNEEVRKIGKQAPTVTQSFANFMPLDSVARPLARVTRMETEPNLTYFYFWVNSAPNEPTAAYLSPLMPQAALLR